MIEVLIIIYRGFGFGLRGFRLIIIFGIITVHCNAVLAIKNGDNFVNNDVYRSHKEKDNVVCVYYQGQNLYSYIYISGYILICHWHVHQYRSIIGDARPHHGFSRSSCMYV